MLFRGRNKITSEWAYGDLYQQYLQTFIMEHNGKICEVFRDTVGQTSGAKDEKGNDIYVDVFPQDEPDVQFHEGELILYQNGSRFEIGKIKKVVDDGAFVFYHDGETAAKTPFDCMRKIVNAHTIKVTSLGGYQKPKQSGLIYICPKCGKKCATLFDNLCIDCVTQERRKQGDNDA